MNLNTLRSEPKLVVIVPSHNRWQQAKLALRSLFESEYRNFEVVLVEDGCVDGTADHCLREFPGVKILHGNGELWWSGSINAGMRYALATDADAIVWLNDDDRVEPETLGRLVASFIRNGEDMVVCSRVKNAADPDAVEFVEQYPPIHHPDFAKRLPKLLDLEEIGKDIAIQLPAGGHGILFPRKCILEIGFTDSESFPQYWADHDYHYRAMNAGYKYVLATDAVVWNTPNVRKGATIAEYSVRWMMKELFSKYSPNNLKQTYRITKRYTVAPYSYLERYANFLSFLFKSFASGWLAKHRTIHSYIRFVGRFAKMGGS
jgi:GT2 family glycosyltransferase